MRAFARSVAAILTLAVRSLHSRNSSKQSDTLQFHFVGRVARLRGAGYESPLREIGKPAQLGLNLRYPTSNLTARSFWVGGGTPLPARALLRGWGGPPLYLRPRGLRGGEGYLLAALGRLRGWGGPPTEVRAVRF